MDVVIFISATKDGDIMSKVDAKQLEALTQEIAVAISMLGADVMRTQKLVFALLKQNGNLTEMNCPHCKEGLMIPTGLPDIEQSDKCPACGNDIYEGSQKTFENWDEGITGEEE